MVVIIVFVGYGPLTAPESIALYNFTLSHNFSMVISYHTQGKVIFWQYQNYTPLPISQFDEIYGENLGILIFGMVL